MAVDQHKPSRRGILAFLAAAPVAVIPALPAAAQIPVLSAFVTGSDWGKCLAEYHAAKAANDEANEELKRVRAACKAEAGKLEVPEGFRNPFTLSLGYHKMSLEELREDLTARRQGPNTPRKMALVEADYQKLAPFNRKWHAIMEKSQPALERLWAAEDRLGEAEDAIAEFSVQTVQQLSEKMVIAQGSDWLMEKVQADANRLAAGGLN